MCTAMDSTSYCGAWGEFAHTAGRGRKDTARGPFSQRGTCHVPQPHFFGVSWRFSFFQANRCAVLYLTFARTWQEMSPCFSHAMRGLVASMLLSTIILAESSLAEGRLPKVRLRGWANEQQRPVTQTTNPVFPRKVRAVVSAGCWQNLSD